MIDHETMAYNLVFSHLRIRSLNLDRLLRFINPFCSDAHFEQSKGTACLLR